jgi:hypothetical protein
MRTDLAVFVSWVPGNRASCSARVEEATRPAEAGIGPRLTLRGAGG